MLAFKKKNKDKNKEENKVEEQSEKQVDQKPMKLDTSKKNEIEDRVKRDIDEREPELKKNKKAFNKRVKNEVQERLLIHNETLSKVAPSGNIKFKDIDFITEGKFATILTFSVKRGSFDNLKPLWGMGLVPKVIKVENTDEFKDKDIVTKTIYSITRRKDDWAEKKVQAASSVSETGYSESKNASQSVSKNYFEEY